MKFIFYTLTLLCLGLKSTVYAQDIDTVANTGANNIRNDSTISKTDSIITTKKQPYAGMKQWRVGADISRIAFNLADPSRQTYEFQLDYKDTDKRYWTAEAGYGRGSIDYDYLNYTTHSTFVKVGMDNSMFKPMSSRDFDIVYLGVRYGAAFGQRTEARYSFESPFGGTFTGSIPSERFFVHWGEITLGMRLEVWKRVFLGWSGRAKFLFNSNRFNEIKPNHIAGYGSADKATSFDINLFLSYAILRYQNK